MEIATLLKSMQDLSTKLTKVETENKRLSNVSTALWKDFQEASDERAALRILVKDLQAHAKGLQAQVKGLQAQVNTKSSSLQSPKGTALPSDWFRSN